MQQPSQLVKFQEFIQGTANIAIDQKYARGRQYLQLYNQKLNEMLSTVEIVRKAKSPQMKVAIDVIRDAFQPLLLQKREFEDYALSILQTSNDQRSERNPVVSNNSVVLASVDVNNNGNRSQDQRRNFEGDNNVYRNESGRRYERGRGQERYRKNIAVTLEIFLSGFKINDGPIMHKEILKEIETKYAVKFEENPHMGSARDSDNGFYAPIIVYSLEHAHILINESKLYLKNTMIYAKPYERRERNYERRPRYNNERRERYEGYYGRNHDREDAGSENKERIQPPRSNVDNTGISDNFRGRKFPQRGIYD